ncbi:MAG TPA: FemAB family XrtA/PEP-CTERM system-associated protein [Isosphaeraceae bacterium]|jgi:FemAB-related protein (PEP-CTERM system-associated)
MTAASGRNIAIHEHRGPALAGFLPRARSYLERSGVAPLSRDPAWLEVLERGLGHVPVCLEAAAAGEIRGLLPLAFVRSLLFGRFLVSLPYLNSGGVLADDDEAARLLIDRAVALAGELGVRYLELRHEQPVEHAGLTARMTSKVHMRLPLPETAGTLWDQIPSKVRNQIRKGQKGDLAVSWGGPERLDEFYTVFSRNMRDLGTPVYGRGLFRAVLEQFPDQAELCVVRAGSVPVAAALLLHGRGVTEVPSASALRAFNPTNCNMLMYWHLLERAVERGQALFDFGRSSAESPTYRFKKQWGAQPGPAEWQYHVRTGQVGEMRPESPRYRLLVRTWQRLPVGLTRLIGPPIVRGIP